MRSIDIYKVQATLQALLDAEQPGRAIHALSLKADDAQAEPFERYAASVLRSAGALLLSDADWSDMRLDYSDEAQLARAYLPPTASKQARSAILPIEDAVNRLLGIRSALVAGVGSPVAALPESPESRRREQYRIRGAEYPLWSDPTRGAHVHLPPLEPSAQATEAYYNEIDWRMLDNVASIAHQYVQSVILVNANQVIFSVKAPNGSEWDVRTRLAAALANLWPSLRVKSRFDCDLGHGAATVHFIVPPKESFPSFTASATHDEMQPIGKEIDAARTVYALRLAALLGAACFGGGKTVENAFVIGKDGDGKVVVSCAFDRRRFIYETLPAIDAGVVSAPDLRFSPEKVQEAIAASFSECASPTACNLPEGVFEGTRVNPHEDDRVLPDDMQRFFHAKRIRDIDTGHYLGGMQHVIGEAREDSHSSIVAAIASLEKLVDETRESLAPPDDIPDARPLFCENPLQRAALVLLDDELNIGADAEAFLSFEEEAPTTLPDVYYFRAPSALFHAHVGLADLYQKLGDLRGAESQADRCIALAPTMPAGYAMKAGILTHHNKSREAANVIMTGLRCAVAPSDQSLLLYNLGFVFRRMGKLEESDALFVYTASLTGIYADTCREIVTKMANGGSAQAYIVANLAEATRTMNELGVPRITARMRHTLIAKAALGLANAHAPKAAAPYIALLSQSFPGNQTIQTTCNSIIRGIS